MSLLSLLRLVVSSFWLEFVLLFSRNNSPSCLSLQSSLTMLRASLILGIFLPIVFPLVVSVVSFHITVPLFVVLLFANFFLLILPPILHQNSLMPHVTASHAIFISSTTSSIPSIPTLFIPLSNSLPFFTSALLLLFLIPILTVTSCPFLLFLLQKSLGYRLIQ